MVVLWPSSATVSSSELGYGFRMTKWRSTVRVMARGDTGEAWPHARWHGDMSKMAASWCPDEPSDGFMQSSFV